MYNEPIIIQQRHIDMWGNTIGRRVAEVIKQRVVAAQKEHDEHVAKLREELNQSTEAHATAMVEKIIGR